MTSLSPRAELFRVIVHPAISVSVSVSAVLAGLALAVRLGGTNGLPLLPTIVAIAAPVIEATVGNALHEERAGLGNRARELIIFLLVVYAAASLLRSGPLGQRFAPSGAHAGPVFAGALAWMLAFDIHNRLRGRESLTRAFHNRHGDRLRSALIDRQHDMALTVRELRAARGLIGSAFAVLATLALIAASGVFSHSSLPAASVAFALLCANGMVTAVTIGTLNVAIDEYGANGVGLAVPLRLQRRRLTAGLIIVGMATAGAFALSRRESPLPLEMIAAFFRWFGGLFSGRRAVSPPPPLPASSTAPGYEALLRMIAESGPELPPLWFRLLMEMLRRLMVSVGIVGVALLIFGPMFSPAFRSGLRSFHPVQKFRMLLYRLIRRVVILTRWLRLRLRTGFHVGGRAAHVADSAVDSETKVGRADQPWRPSARKRLQMDRATAVFASVARWGAAHDLRYVPSDGPHEYFTRIATLHPEHYVGAQLCAHTFSEARYSRHTVARNKMREYVRAARRITATG